MENKEKYKSAIPHLAVAIYDKFPDEPFCYDPLNNKILISSKSNNNHISGIILSKF